MKRLLTLMILVVLVLSAMAVSAQNEEISGYMVQTATSGTFSDNGDDTYTLALELTSDYGAVVINSPTLNLFNYALLDLAGDWVFADGLTAEALLETGNLSIRMTISVGDEAYDVESDMFSYIVTIDEITTSDANAKKISLPESFDNAILAISFNDDVITGLRAGHEARLSSTRGTSNNPPCCD